MVRNERRYCVRIDPDAVIWSAPERDRAARPLLVLMHGFGSHEGDLFELSRSLPLEPVVASIRAPLVEGSGYAWFPRSDGTDATHRFDAAADAARAVLDWLDTTTSSSVGVLGFSQGAAIALQLLREQPTRFAYAIPLSGFVLPVDHDGDARLAELRPPVFWGRGTADDVIPESLVNHTLEWLPQHSTLTQGIYEDVGHWVSPEEISELGAFIHSHL